jgi:hypothetical protein
MQNDAAGVTGGVGLRGESADRCSPGDSNNGSGTVR